MNYPRYELSDSNNSMVFEFTSIGIHGNIRKVIRFSATDNDLVYMLGFGNKIEIDKNEFKIDDISVNNNGDRNKILATITDAIFLFTELHPEVYINFTGSTPSRNRLYRIAISNNLGELSDNFDIFGIIYDVKKGKQVAIPFNHRIDFIGFLIFRKHG